MSSVTAESSHASLEHPSAASRLSLWRRGYAALLRRLGRWFDLRLVWIFRRTITPPKVEPRAEPGYSFRKVTAAELIEAAADPALELSRERIKDAAARGDLLFGVFHRNRVIAYRWYSLSGSTPCWEGMEIGYEHPQRAYGYRTFTHPAHRGKRLHAYSLAQSDIALAASRLHTYASATSMRRTLRLCAPTRTSKAAAAWAAYCRFGRSDDPGCSGAPVRSATLSRS